MSVDVLRFNQLRHKAQFLFARGLTSSAMDDWNNRLVQLGYLMDDNSPSRTQNHVMKRILGKLEKATDKQLRKTGLYDEWHKAWATDSSSGADAADADDPTFAQHSRPNLSTS